MTTETSTTINNANIMTQLKTQTATAHKQLEKSACFKRIFAEDYSLNEYARLLSYFYSYFMAIEPLIFAELPNEYHGYLQHRRKIPFLIQDLTALHIDINTLASCNVLPPLTSIAQKMGAFYVLEGSLLGGRVISEHLKKQLGESVFSALNFYNCYGENLYPEWQKFNLLMCQRFDNQSNEVINELISNANATFATLQQWVESQQNTVD